MISARALSARLKVAAAPASAPFLLQASKCSLLLQRAPHATHSTAAASNPVSGLSAPAPAPAHAPAPVASAPLTTTWNGLTSPREGLPRFPSASATGLVRLLDYAGTVAFSASGALTALGCGCDLFGACAIGIITSCGGGTWRDVIVYRCQPFWFEEWEYLVLALLGAGGIFLAWEHLEPAPAAPASFWQGFTLKSASGGEGVAMEWADHVAFGAFAVIGSMGAIRNQAPLLVVPICATMTCTFGGLTRDTLLNRPVRILHPYADAYAPIAFGGGCLYALLRSLAPGAHAARIAATVGSVAFARQQATADGWRLPWWNARSVVTYGNADPRIASSADARPSL